MSDSDFSGMDFGIGSVVGFRRWKVDVSGVLTALHRTGTWLPGMNDAECQGHPKPDQVEKKREDEDYKSYNERVKAWKSNHDMNACEHGFYAYFDGSEDSYGIGPTVAGVIEGSGEVLIGTKGFRAMKARIIALSLAPHEGIWKLEQFVTDRIRENYPGVPIFGSELAMRAEYPTSRHSEFAADQASIDRAIAKSLAALRQEGAIS